MEEAVIKISRRLKFLSPRYLGKFECVTVQVTMLLCNVM